jgi:hypothetical protein
MDAPKDPLSLVAQSSPQEGLREALSKVSAALGDAKVTHGEMLLFIPVFLAFYADTYNLDLRQLFENLYSDAKRAHASLSRVTLLSDTRK